MKSNEFEIDKPERNLKIGSKKYKLMEM